MIRNVSIAALVALTLSGAACAAPPPPMPPAASIGPPAAGDWRTPDPENLMVIDTTKGRIVVELSPEVAPKHVERVKGLTRQGFYDGRSFFRVIDLFMAQTGDPKEDGTGGSDQPDLAAEFTFRRGVQTPFVQVADQTVADIGFIGALPVMTQSSMLMAMTADNKVSGWALYCPGVAGMARGETPIVPTASFS